MLSARLMLFGGLAIFLCYALLVIASGVGWNPIGLEWSFENSGQFGDSFGFLSATMAALAAYAAWSAYNLQSQEIDQLRTSQRQQEAASNKRDFEQSFFNILELLRQTVREVEYNNPNERTQSSGREALTSILHSIRRRTAFLQEKNFSHLDAIKSAYEKIYQIYKDDLGHYFRLLYHLLKFIDQAPISDRKLYARILRATLSNTEICLVGLNCAHGGRKRKLTPLVECYHMLHNISKKTADEFLLITSLPIECFGDRAFGDSGDSDEEDG